MLLFQNVIDWTSQLLPLLIPVILLYSIAIIVVCFIIKKAVSAGTKEQRRLAATTNNLLTELLKVQGADLGKLKDLTQQK
jgi:hypothetical protein